MANEHGEAKKPEENVDYEAVLAFLQKRGLQRTVDILRNEVGGANLNNSSASVGTGGKITEVVH